ncbi:hypothetical protein [Nocardia huaxiensis]|uniref:hypothetical protein n=1 Tax=Nocardia huaxiensis TaxID=2755382 RepID=UPI001E3C3BF1|nr:hypothetical protein [Nocardia huaxiensis]UFS99062.1 hypothetical protein LPY97_14755 [Nocardia huaxiensis]
MSAEANPVTDLADHVVAYLEDPSPLLGLLSGVEALRVADNLVQEMLSRRVPREKLRNAARFVAENATEREVAKLGIILLGVSGDERDAELLDLLGSLEEFSLFAVVALKNTQPDAQRKIFDLAQRLNGWGRIHAVERLRGSTDPEVRAWLLRSGFRNGVMNEYLAHLAATTGGLHEALLADAVDDELLDGAADILVALAPGGPAGNLNHYDDAIPVLERFADLIAGAEPTIGRLQAVLGIGSIVRDQGLCLAEDERVRLSTRYAALAEPLRWQDIVWAALESPVESDDAAPESGRLGQFRFNAALSCAGQLGMDGMPSALERLREDPYNAYVWQWAVQHANATTIDQVVGLAEEILPLRQLGSGPTESLGLGREYQVDRAFEVVVWGLKEHPGRGGALLAVALTNRVIRSRRGALNALEAWPPAARPPGTAEWVAAAAEREPNSDLRADMRTFLDRL